MSIRLIVKLEKNPGITLENACMRIRRASDVMSASVGENANGEKVIWVMATSPGKQRVTKQRIKQALKPHKITFVKK